ncbi:MAG: hypothetical protein ACQESR_14750 [Planctomycetota bacterium]
MGDAYAVYVTWTADTGDAENTHYQVYAGSTAGRLLAEADLDQTGAPSTPSDFRAFADAAFERLATVELHADDAGTLVVRLSNNSATSGDTLVADGGYVVRESPMAQTMFDHGGRLASAWASLSALSFSLTWSIVSAMATAPFSPPSPSWSRSVSTPPFTTRRDHSARQIAGIQKAAGTNADLLLMNY